MFNMLLKEWVCTVPEETLKQVQDSHKSRSYGWIHDYLWREIRIAIDESKIVVDIWSVDEEAASGGYWRGAIGPQTMFTLLWPDLADVENVDNLLQYETLKTANTVKDMLKKLRELSGSLPAALKTLK